MSLWKWKRYSKMHNNGGFERWILCDACEVLLHMVCVNLNRAQEEVGTVIWLTFCSELKMAVFVPHVKYLFSPIQPLFSESNIQIS